MDNKDLQHSRICVLESSFEQFTRLIDNHIVKNEEEIKELNKSIKEVIAHIDKGTRYTQETLINTKRDLLKSVADQYETKADIQKQLTSLRKSLLVDIEKERKKAQNIAWIIFICLTASASLFGWLYTNVLQVQP